MLVCFGLLTHILLTKPKNFGAKYINDYNIN